MSSKSSMNSLLTIVVTVYNEVDTIRQAIRDAQSLDIEKEIIVIDNFSTDGTRDILREMEDGTFSVVYQDRNYGYGKSVETGIRLAKGEYIYIQMSDLEYDYMTSLEMLKVAKENGYDVVIGSRLKGLKNLSYWRVIRERPAYLASIISTFLINWWYNKRFTDVIGSKLYKTSSIRSIKINTYGPGFEFEHVCRMCKARLGIGEVPVKYKPRVKGKKMKPYHMLNALIALFKERL